MHYTTCIPLSVGALPLLFVFIQQGWRKECIDYIPGLRRSQTRDHMDLLSRQLTRFGHALLTNSFAHHTFMRNFQGLWTTKSNFNSLFSQSGSQKGEPGAKKRKKQTQFQLLAKSKCTKIMFLVWVNTPNECIYFDLYWFRWLINFMCCLSTYSFMGSRVHTFRAQPNKRKQTKFHFIQGSLTGYSNYGYEQLDRKSVV